MSCRNEWDLRGILAHADCEIQSYSSILGTLIASPTVAAWVVERHCPSIGPNLQDLE